jgi:hypothetical protein
MRITDDRLDDLVDAFIERQADQRDFAAVILALTELQDRRDDEYDDANDNYETALDIVQAAHPDEDYSWARPRDDDPDDGVSWDEGEGYLNADGSDEEDEEAYLAGDGIPDDDRFFHVPPWDFDPDVGVDDDDTF